jgi:predicted ATPase
MEITVKNFGPIKHGSIDLSKRFYVFVGHNNSGKTYMANLMWSACNTMNFHHIRDEITNEFIEKYQDNLTIVNNETQFIINSDVCDSVMEIYIKKLNEILASNLGIDKTNFIIENLRLKVNYDFDELLSKSAKEKLYILDFDEKTDIYSLEKEANNDRVILIKKEDIEFDKASDKMIDFFQQYIKTYKVINLRRDKIDNKEILHDIVEMIIRSFLKESVLDVFLPANRLFYPSFYRYVYEAAKTDKDKIDEEVRKGNPSLDKIKSLSKRPYTKAMDDLLTKIYRLDASQKPKGTYIDLLEKLRQLMGGEIITKNAEGIGLNEFKLKMDSGEELDLYLSSSAANQLTTLYLYLKYWANDENNFLIMDEPEENLHPKHQIALLDILMQFANRNNNRVLITTHSSLLAESVNNHIQIGKLQDLGEDVEKIVQENNLNISLNDNLRPDDFGVYFFGNNTITPYDVDDYGVFFRDFKQEEDKVTSTAQVLSEHIYHSLRKDKTVSA